MCLSEIGHSAPYRSRVSLKSIEARSPVLPEIGKLRKGLVVGDGSLGFPPQLFDGIELWRVVTEEMEFKETFLPCGPLTNRGRLVIRGVVSDEVDLDPAVVPGLTPKICSGL